MSVLDAITSRRSIRAFKPDPVPEETIREILEVAKRAPSGSNIQPWKTYVLTGTARDRLVQAMRDHRSEHGEAQDPQYAYYPVTWREPYQSRRRACGWGLYELCGIQRGDREAGARQRGRNFEFFDAPVGMIFTIDDDLEQGSWLDYGMFVQSVMLAARGFGLHTCPQAAWAYNHKVIRPAIGIPDHEMVVCGLALGWADESKPENGLITEREPLENFVVFQDS